MFIVAGLIVAIVCALVRYAASSRLCERTLRADLVALQRIYGALPRVGSAFTATQAAEYYRATTRRDYRRLEWVMGPGMHTQLTAPHPVGSQGRGTRQALIVLAEIRAVGAATVLEIGMGRGYCTLLLAAIAPDVHFWGIDLLEEHVEAAAHAARCARLTNVTFLSADATRPLDRRLGRTFDVIFGCESLCHVGARAGVATAASLLRRGGCLVVVDGFRSASFPHCSEAQRTAMRLVEFGFRLNALPSKAQWIARGQRCGLRVRRNLDWTAEALPYWTLGWRLARVLLLFPAPVRWYLRSSADRRHTGHNLLAVATFAHALRDGGAAEYGMLVLQK